MVDACINNIGENIGVRIIIIQLSDPNLKDFSFFLFMAHCAELEPNVFFVYHRIGFYRPFLEYTTLLFYDSEFWIGIAG